MVVNGRPIKRMKRRVTADLYNFLTFPASSSSSPPPPGGPFRANVRSFLTEHALLSPPSSLFPHLLTWQISFRVGDLVECGGGEAGPEVVSLDVVEEDVARSRSVYCDQCRVVEVCNVGHGMIFPPQCKTCTLKMEGSGLNLVAYVFLNNEVMGLNMGPLWSWSEHPVCCKRYHFVIKADGNSIDGYHKLCSCCGNILHLSESRCKTCNHIMTADDVEEWVYHQLEDTTHLLHGVIHANGYGHLLRVNGKEGGSRVLSGCHIMDFWDRLCKSLGVSSLQEPSALQFHACYLMLSLEDIHGLAEFEYGEVFDVWDHYLLEINIALEGLKFVEAIYGTFLLDRMPYTCLEIKFLYIFDTGSHQYYSGDQNAVDILYSLNLVGCWLSVRKVSVMDVSKKYGIEYRLLHAITKGHSWYGDWGYEFGAGSFCLTADAYKSAVEILSNLPLSIFLYEGQKTHTRLQDTIKSYQSLSDRELVNTRDLFCYLTSLIHDAHKSASRVDDSSCKKRHFYAPGISPSWTWSDIERVEEAMFRVLRAVSGSNWVSWRALRGAVFKVAPPELLDHCLKELGGKFAADGVIVRSRCNPSSGAFEYRLEPGNPSLNSTAATLGSTVITCPSEENLIQDLRFLYENILLPQTMLSFGHEVTGDARISSARKLLDCKQFMKDYNNCETAMVSVPNTMFLSCEVEIADQLEENVPNLPPETVVLPSNATVSDLKREASRAFQDVYLMLRRFDAEELLGNSGVDDSTQVKLLVRSTESVRLRGRCLGKNGLGKFRMERGTERWTVDCCCGAKDDDGERMLACDVCGVWQHTRCSGIPDSDSVPAKFVCLRCRGSSLRRDNN
ncbi:hypothetical protein DKX38_006100 [Salix brachista]|uniref:Zinc finger PHD-type domain-containing protein n=1 Tax=Salix brachista TaxID=2182728 RepID=A0A5N5N3C0_9ROSI|nr:hypothetical protein DKX38_006100 [Salix brachista]